MLLALDTSTRNASVALYDADGVRAEISWQTRANHTVETMLQILRALELASVEKKNLVAIGVALGPGSFTGLRVGMSLAKGLALAGKIPLLGIPTLDAIAAAHSLQPLALYAVLTAGRGRYSVAPYAAQDGRAVRVGDYALVNAAQLVGMVEKSSFEDDLRPRILFCGEINTALRETIAQNLGMRAVIASPALNARRAGFLAELAWARYTRGQADDVASLAPMYAPHDTV